MKNWNKTVIDCEKQKQFFYNYNKKGDMRGVIKNNKNVFDWNMVNWDSQDVVIARGLGCSREAVRQKRKLLGKGKSLNFHKINVSIMNKILEMDTSNMKLEDIADKMGCSKFYVKNVLKENNKPFIVVDRRKGGKYEWAKANWDKTDKKVALELGVRNTGVVTGHRRRMGIIKNRVKIVAAQKERTCWESVRVKVQ